MPKKKSYMLRTCAADGSAWGGFRWPLTIGAEVVAPDWDPRPECGNGLHGLADGAGDGSHLQIGVEGRIALVCSYEAGTAVDIGGKVKVPRCVVEFVGAIDDAGAWLRKRLPAAKRSLCYAGTATAGVRGTATAGYAGTARTGPDGLVVIHRWADGRYRKTIGEAGDGIDPWFWYVVDEASGKLRRATDDELRERKVDPATNGVAP